jgi:trigger factor
MQVSIESTSSLGRRLTVSVPAVEVKSAIEARMKEVARTARLDGFRPGKVPLQLIQQKYGAQIRQEAISKIIETSLPEAMQQQSLEPAGRPYVEKVVNLQEEGKDLEYVVSFEVFPEFTLPDFSKIEIEKFKADITEADVIKAVEKLQTQFATWTPVGRAADEGDRLTVDYTSTLNGKPYENSSGKDVLIELGSNLFIEGFEGGLLGLKAGESQELDLHFPAEWRMEKLAGKPVHFSIQVKEVAEKKLASLEEMAKRIGIQEADLAAIQQKVRENLEKQLDHLIDEDTKKKALDGLLALCPIPLPKALVENEMSVIHEDLHRRSGDKAQGTCNHQGLEEEAERRVALSLILRSLVKSQNLTPNKDKVREKIAEIAKSFGNAEFIEKMYYESEELLANVQNTVLVDQAIGLILEKAHIVPKTISVDELQTKI